MKKKLWQIPILLAVLVWMVPAHAYVLPGPHLLDLMTRQIGSTQTLTVSQRQVVFQNPSPAGGATLQETLYCRYPTSYRLESKSQSAHRINVGVYSEHITIMDGMRIAGGEEDLWDRYKDLLVYRSRPELQARLSQTGLDVMTSSLGRFQGRPCYVIGAQYPDFTLPQIWFEKETFFPILYMLPNILPDGTLDILTFRYLDWRKKDGLWYPMHIQFLRGERVAREIFVDDLVVNPALDATLFDLEFIKNRYPETTWIGPEQAPPVAPNDIEKAIEEFKKRFE